VRHFGPPAGRYRPSYLDARKTKGCDNTTTALFLALDLDQHHVRTLSGIHSADRTHNGRHSAPGYPSRLAPCLPSGRIGFVSRSSALFSPQLTGSVGSNVRPFPQVVGSFQRYRFGYSQTSKARLHSSWSYCSTAKVRCRTALCVLDSALPHRIFRHRLQLATKKSTRFSRYSRKMVNFTQNCTWAAKGGLLWPQIIDRDQVDLQPDIEPGRSTMVVVDSIWRAMSIHYG
jgi:hypothetical protein